MTSANGIAPNFKISPKIGNRYVKRPVPVTVACTSSSASFSIGSSITISQNEPFHAIDKECSSITSSSLTTQCSDKIRPSNRRKQEALFSEILQRAPVHPQR